MFLRILIVMAYLVSGLSVQAQDRQLLHFYAGAVTGGSSLSIDGSSGDTSLDAGGIAGVSWRNQILYTALEAEVSTSIISPSSNTVTKSTGASISVLAGFMAQSNLALFGRVGFEHDQFEFGSSSTTESASGLRLGIGADYGLNRNLRVRAEIGRSFLNGAFADELRDTEMRFALIHQF